MTDDEIIFNQIVKDTRQLAETAYALFDSLPWETANAIKAKITGNKHFLQKHKTTAPTSDLSAPPNYSLITANICSTATDLAIKATEFSFKFAELSRTLFEMLELNAKNNEGKVVPRPIWAPPIDDREPDGKR